MKCSGLWLPVTLCLVLSSCVGTPPPATLKTQPMSALDTSWRADSGFNLTEAKALIEICTRLDYGYGAGQNYLSPGIAEPANTVGWEEIRYTPPPYTAQDPPNFAPYDNAWALYRKTGSNIYVIAIRGTVDTRPSAIEDMIATSIAAYPVRLPVNTTQMLSFLLAETPGSETHLGWTYAMAELMFNARYGILNVLRDKVPPNSRLLITGHSQGAAIATLVHAFLHYGITRNEFGLGNSGYTLKSYVFAQPKPGNWQFAMDFARIAGGEAFVVNNDRDWVPQTPLSIEFLDEPGSDLLVSLARNPSLGSVINSVLAAGAIGYAQASRAVIALHVQNETIKAAVRESGLDPQYFTGLEPELPAFSVNYALAGTQVPVFGSASSKIPQDNTGMAEHHGPVYRMLLESPAAEGGPPPSLAKPEGYVGSDGLAPRPRMVAFGYEKRSTSDRLLIPDNGRSPRPPSRPEPGD